MRKSFKIVGVVLLSLLTAGSHFGNEKTYNARSSRLSETKRDYRLISGQHLLEKITNEEKFTLIDCRPPEEYKAGHIPGAFNVSIDSYGFDYDTKVKAELKKVFKIQNKTIDLVLVDKESGEEYMPKAKMEELLGHLPEDRNEVVIFYCRRPNCTRSPLAARWSVTLGYKNVFRFQGGWQEWHKRYQEARLDPQLKTQKRGQFFVIGTGPAGAHMSTLQALETIKKMDFIIASDEHAKLFKDYIQNKSLLFDPWKGLFDYKGKNLHQLTREEREKFKAERFRIRDSRVKEIKSLLDEGKNVGLLDNGNPCLFAPSHMYIEQFDSQEVVIIPGMGSDAAAMAVLGKSVIPAFNTRLVVQSSPMLMVGPRMQDLELLKDIGKYPAALVMYMALGNPEKLFSTLAEVYPENMTCAVVFWAGYPEKQRIVQGTIADMGKKLMNEKEKYMGLLFIGDFLGGNPYESAVK